MAKINPKIFDSWTDPNGGEWIRIKTGLFEGVTWRPLGLDMDDNGIVSFTMEYFEGPNITKPPPPEHPDYQRFERVCTSCIHDILQSYMSEDDVN